MSIRWTLGTVCMALAMAASGCSTPGMHAGLPAAHNLPPAQMLMHPGPGVDGPGPGVMAPMAPADMMGGAGMGLAGMPAAPVQVQFVGPESAQVRFDVSGVGQYDSEALVLPARQNFPPGGVYRLKLSNIDGHEGVELYPTLELGQPTPRTAAYLDHSAVPVQFNDEDFDQVLNGNFVTKVIYIPDPEFQQLAAADVDVLVSTRLDPGQNPVVEADRRGAIVAIVRMGNKDMQIPGTQDAVAMQAAYEMAIANGAAAGGCMPDGSMIPPAFMAGVTAPAYGMPITGTPIGLPGPAHIPLGVPAGLQRHTIENHTAMNIPGPTDQVNVHVKQVPGLSYPRPADQVLIRERTIRAPHFNNQPPADMVHGAPPACGLNGITGYQQCQGATLGSN